MSSLFSKDIRVLQPNSRRVKIFIDFWNVVINVRKCTKYPISIRWDRLAQIILRETDSRYGDQSQGQIAGCFIFGSWSKSSPEQRRFVEKTLDDYGALAGLFFDFRERISKETGHKCEKCGETVKLSSEVGVDILLTVEAIKHASMKEHEYLAIVSSDRDFLPLLNYLKDQGQRVIHVASGEAHREMRSATWKQLKISNFISDICRLEEPGTILIVSSQSDHDTDRVEEMLKLKSIAYRKIDATKKEDISDRDLIFLIDLFRVSFQSPGDASAMYLDDAYRNNIYKLRKDIYDKKINTEMPMIIHNGNRTLWRSLHSGWSQNGSMDTYDIWLELNEEDNY